MTLMETMEKPHVDRRFVARRLVDSGAHMETRMTRVESTTAHILDDLGIIKADLRDMRTHMDTEFRDIRTHIDTELRDIRTHIDTELRDIRSELRDFRAYVDSRFQELTASMRTEFRLIWAAFFGLAGLLAKGFHWI